MPSARTPHVSTIAAVPAVAADGPRPAWSVMIPTTGRSPWLAQAIASALHDDPGPAQLEVAVLDNAASDPATIAAAIGPHRERVQWVRTATPLGMAANWNRALAGARGRWVLVLHDDDALAPGCLHRYAAALASAPQAVAVHGRSPTIAGDGAAISAGKCPPGHAGTGIVDDALAKLTLGNFVAASSMAVSRELLARVGGFDDALRFAADWELWLRVAAAGPLLFVDEPSTLRRIHPAAETLRRARTAENVAEIALCVRRGLALLPPPRRRATAHRAWANAAAHAHGWHTRFRREHELRPALAHALWTLRLTLLASATRHFGDRHFGDGFKSGARMGTGSDLASAPRRTQP